MRGTVCGIKKPQNYKHDKYYLGEKKLETAGDRSRIAQLSKYRNDLHPSNSDEDEARADQKKFWNDTLVEKLIESDNLQMQFQSFTMRLK